jgi:hypothetical protein
MVRNQIDNLTFGPSFGHNLCFKYSNGSCKPILNIYVSRNFQWYKELFNPMSFWFVQSPSNDLGIHRDSNSQNGSTLGSVGVHFLAFLNTLRSMKCGSWASFLAHTFASFCLSCEPKAKVATGAKANSSTTSFSKTYTPSIKSKKLLYVELEFNFRPVGKVYIKLLIFSM